MKVPALQRLRAKLRSSQPVYGLWITLESPSICEMAVALGLDWVTIDAEHGHLDWKEIVEHVRAAVRSETVVLVRLAENSPALIKRALDVGADGVVLPWIETVAQLEAAVAAATYPPGGVRGIGAERATCWGNCFVEHAAEADVNVLVVPIIETVRAVENIEQLAAVEGVEAYFFGPADLSSTAGYPGKWEGPGVPEMIAKARTALRRAGKHCGVVATSEQNLTERREQGFGMLGLGLDAGLLLRSLHAALGSQGRDRQIRASFTLENDAVALAKEQAVACAPPNMRPDRAEVMNARGSGPQLEITRGVTFDCMVGAHNHARNLTTGLVTFAPGAVLPMHRHTFGESVTLLQGRALVDVEGRLYEVGPLDNVTIPRGLAHRVSNLSRSAPAVFHIAMASHDPTRELVDRILPRRTMSEITQTQPGGERATYQRSATRYSPGANAAFVDYFNADLIPGLEMSGGYGLFQQGGRLPAHLHDFDESICIVTGRATCIVEGRRYSMENLATALQPRGRIHYFINETPAPMAMIWVYAGPQPERIVVDERCAVEPAVAWNA
ncbi:cupin domain-containing protein [Horticoccus luteus]|uniref:Cupin domain-containing protein n=1 Tax=Horticoccus luteus TaxID=2862869 RepID=A0A8F9TYW6_9BACT|nr:aldolase/citrate lyase family protein [Horticoccus luteus]QYM80690.1 cupin domain-containing protein [Horticoccus luteus]